MFLIFISLYLCFFLSVISFPSLPSERIQTLPQFINKCWEIAMLFFAKYIFIGSARPRVCSKIADTGFPLSHRRVCHSFSSTECLLSPRHSGSQPITCPLAHQPSLILQAFSHMAFPFIHYHWL